MRLLRFRGLFSHHGRFMTKTSQSLTKSRDAWPLNLYRGTNSALIGERRSQAHLLFGIIVETNTMVHIMLFLRYMLRD